MNGLGLREQERVSLTGGLPCFQPLHTGRLRRCAISDFDRRGRPRQLDVQRRAEYRIRFPKRESSVIQFVTDTRPHGLDRQVACIEY